MAVTSTKVGYLAFWADDGLGGEGQGLAQDVVKGAVALGALEGREAVQQLVHKDAK